MSFTYSQVDRPTKGEGKRLSKTFSNSLLKMSKSVKTCKSRVERVAVLNTRMLTATVAPRACPARPAPPVRAISRAGRRD